MPKDMEIAGLLDFYGETLTKKQRYFLECYYNDDLSLSEIAENEGITRQGVRDAVMRAGAQLEQLEEQLGVMQRYNEMREALKKIIQYSDSITEYNLRHSISKEINDLSVMIKTEAMLLLESD